VISPEAISFSVTAVTSFGTWHSSTARKHFQALASIPVTVISIISPALILQSYSSLCEVHKIGESWRWIFHQSQWAYFGVSQWEIRVRGRTSTVDCDAEGSSLDFQFPN